MAPTNKQKRQYLTVQQRLEVLKLRQRGWTQQEVAEKFGVARTTLLNIDQKKFVI